MSRVRNVVSDVAKNVANSFDSYLNQVREISEKATTKKAAVVKKIVTPKNVTKTNSTKTSTTAAKPVANKGTAKPASFLEVTSDRSENELESLDKINAELESHLSELHDELSHEASFMGKSNMEDTLASEADPAPAAKTSTGGVSNSGANSVSKDASTNAKASAQKVESKVKAAAPAPAPVVPKKKNFRKASNKDSNLVLNPMPGQDDAPISIRPRALPKPDLKFVQSIAGSHGWVEDQRALVAEMDASDAKAKTLRLHLVEVCSSFFLFFFLNRKGKTFLFSLFSFLTHFFPFLLFSIMYRKRIFLNH